MRVKRVERKERGKKKEKREKIECRGGDNRQDDDAFICQQNTYTHVQNIFFSLR